jgi:nitric oxide dioxygenase
MTAKQIQLIKMSLARIAPAAEPVAVAFYARLFELNPSLRLMFPANLDEQGRKLMQILGAVVGMLNRPDSLIPALESLGRRLSGYGLRDEHYDTVCEALLWTLERGLGPLFTDEGREAWTALYQVVSTTMQNAARTERALVLG